MSGWSNDSCKVISLETSERKVGNRGTKSVMYSITVKAQRVDGSYIGSNLPMLRCTLKSFQINLLVINTPPNLAFSISYTTVSLQTTTDLKLDPLFVTGGPFCRWWRLFYYNFSKKP